MSAGALSRRVGRRVGGVGTGILTGFAAVGAKELRGRMRGRRAFVVVTIYLLLLSLFAWGIYQYKLQVTGDLFSGSGAVPDVPPGNVLAAATRSAEVGHALFAGLLLLLTILVLVLAPALTSGTISQEHEKQTLEMLVATPLSTTGMVLSKLLSALVYLFLLILASIPVASVVFTFGGVGPEDVVRAYVLLFAVAFGLGAIGLFFSAIARRTQVATVLSYITILAIALGSFVLWVFWYGIASSNASTFVDGRFVRRLPPQQVLWLNPFVADLDVMCGAGLDRTCELVGQITNRPWFGSFTTGGGTDVAVPREILAVPVPAVTSDGMQAEAGIRRPPPEGGTVAAADDVFSTPRDMIWPQIAATFVGLGLALTLLSAQLVAPTRRMRFGRPRRRAPDGAASPIIVDAGTGDIGVASEGPPPAAEWEVAPVEPVGHPATAAPHEESAR